MVSTNKGEAGQAEHIQKIQRKGASRYEVSEPAQIAAADRWMTRQEAADYMRVSKLYVSRLVHRGELTAYGLRTRWRFKLSDVEAWMIKTRLSEERLAAIRNPK